MRMCQRILGTIAVTSEYVLRNRLAELAKPKTRHEKSLKEAIEKELDFRHRFPNARNFH